MNFKKIVAAIAAAATAVTMTAVSAFAFDMNTEYTGPWSQSAVIPKSELAAVGGDVKVTLNVEQKIPLVGDINSLIKPIDACGDWSALTWTGLTSDTAYAKEDGFIVVPAGATTIEFVIPESMWSAFVDWDGTDAAAGLTFQVNDVIIKSAEFSSASPAGEFKKVTEAESGEIMKNGAPAADTTTEASTEAPATGNAPVAAIAVVMALAGAAAVASKKN